MDDPTEAYNHPCMIVQENETAATCSVGLIIAKPEYLNAGRNQDSKRTFAAASLANAWWLLRHHPYPPNFWETMPHQQRMAIMAAGGGTLRLAALFKAVQNRPISRLLVQGIAQQDDYMKRIRRKGGARDILAPEGIAILWGQGDRTLIGELGLGPVGPDEFVSYEPKNEEEANLLRTAKHID